MVNCVVAYRQMMVILYDSIDRQCFIFQKLVSKSLLHVNVSKWVCLEWEGLFHATISHILHKYLVVKYHTSKIPYLTLSEGHSCHKAVILHIVPAAGRVISRMTWTRGKKWNQLLQLALREDWFLRVTYGAQLMGLGFCRLPGNGNLCTNVPGVLNALFFSRI